MKLIAFATLLVAALVARAAGITNAEFFNQIQDKGDVEDLDTLPDVVDDDTIVLTGGPDDELDDEFLTKALLVEPPSSDDDDDDDEEDDVTPWYHWHLRRRRKYQKPYGAGTSSTRYKSKIPDDDETAWWHHWHHVHHVHHFHRYRGSHRRRRQDQNLAVTSSTRCRSKSIIVNLDQPKKITQTFCLRLTRLSKTVYHARLVQNEHVLFNNQVMILGKFKVVCVPSRSASNSNACVHFRLEGSSVCTKIDTDFWSGLKSDVDFGCMEPEERTE